MQGTFPAQAGKPCLSQVFICGYCHTVRKIQAPGLNAHRDTDALLWIVYQNFFRDAGTFLAEHQVSLLWVLHHRIILPSLGREEIEFCSIIDSVEKIFNIPILDDGEQVPIIQPGAFELFFPQAESQGVDKMQRCAGSSAGPGYVAGILWYFWFKQYDVQCHGPNLPLEGNQYKGG